MTVQQVLYVLEIAKCQSISRAAEQLFISQSALSQQIKRLETELGATLFLRTVQGVRLTEEGVLFCERAKPIAAEWSRFFESIREEIQHTRKQLRICLGSRVYSNNLFAEIVGFFSGMPELEVTFITEAGREFFSDLRSGAVDLVLDCLPQGKTREEMEDLYICGLIWERQCILMSPGDPRAALPYLTMQELHGSCLMTGLEGSAEDQNMRAIFQKYGFSPERIYRSDGIDTIMSLVRSGTGIAIGPESFAAHYRVAAVPLQPENVIPLNFICLSDGVHRREIAAFRDFLCNACAHISVPPAAHRSH